MSRLRQICPGTLTAERRRPPVHAGEAQEEMVEMSQQTTTEKFDVKGGHLVAKVKELVHEGNVRRIIIKDSRGRTALEIPVTLGVVGFLLAPTMAAIGALAAVAADYSIEVERDIS
jgi:hypothetical protein